MAGCALHCIFRRLKEQYSLHGQLYCNPESLLPGQAVPLLLQLSLQLHGRVAPLKLLQEVTLRVTAATHDGAEVTEVQACRVWVEHSGVLEFQTYF